MSFLPSPPSSPLLLSTSEKAICGSCDQELGIGWFCSQCHTKCSTCSRILTGHDYCTRCWLYDSGKLRQNNISLSSTLASPLTLTTSFAPSLQHSIPSPVNSNRKLWSGQDEPILPLNLFTPPFVS
ncbi:unnamed protein product [Absidia cylindrospora]